MQRNANFLRLLFIVFATLATTSYEITITARDALVSAIALGIIKGILLSLIIFAAEAQVKKFSLKNLNTVLLGIIIGTAMGWAVTNAMKTLFSLLTLNASSELFDFFALTTYLGSIYFSLVACYQAGNEWWLSIPFVRLTPTQTVKQREILIDITALEDTRIIDLARTGLLDSQLILPSFVMKEVSKGLESSDEGLKNRSKKCLDQIKRLEAISHLNMQEKEFHQVDNEDLNKNLIKMAKANNASIITSDAAIKQEADNVQIICLETIANTIKPTAQRGEMLTIKIQRPGKEPKQGVGYLEDGTMVVVNGGGDFLGETIKTQVLSQKYSTSGKIIFCNALQDENSAPSTSNASTTPYFVPQSQRQEAYATVARPKKEPGYDHWNRH